MEVKANIANSQALYWRLCSNKINFPACSQSSAECRLLSGQFWSMQCKGDLFWPDDESLKNNTWIMYSAQLFYLYGKQHGSERPSWTSTWLNDWCGRVHSIYAEQTLWAGNLPFKFFFSLWLVVLNQLRVSRKHTRTVQIIRSNEQIAPDRPTSDWMCSVWTIVNWEPNDCNI